MGNCGIHYSSCVIPTGNQVSLASAPSSYLLVQMEQNKNWRKDLSYHCHERLKQTNLRCPKARPMESTLENSAPVARGLSVCSGGTGGGGHTSWDHND